MLFTIFSVRLDLLEAVQQLFKNIIKVGFRTAALDLNQLIILSIKCQESSELS